LADVEFNMLGMTLGPRKRHARVAFSSERERSHQMLLRGDSSEWIERNPTILEPRRREAETSRMIDINRPYTSLDD